MRGGLRAMIQGLDEFDVIGEAPDGREAVRLTEELNPDLIVMDIGLPGLNGIEATRQILKLRPQARVLILSMHLNEEFVKQALEAGATGYVLKDAPVNELVSALKSVADGQTHLSPPISRIVIDDYIRRTRQESVRTRYDALTAREREILQLIAEGKTNKDIARLLNVSVNTIETHRAHVMEKLDIHDLAGLIRYAIQKGLTPSQP
jgi:DNA-binding NarL/FixJ family response regulator